MRKNTTKNKNNQVFLLLVNIAILVAVLFAFFKLGTKEVLEVSAVAVNVRSGPGVSYDIQSQVTKGTTIEVVETQNDWYKIAVKGKTKGWVASWLLDNSQNSTNANVMATVNADDTKMQKENNATSETLAQLDKGDMVTVSKENDDWSQVTFGKQTGWIQSTLLDFTNQETNSQTANEKRDEQLAYAIQDETNIRETPDVNGELVTQVMLGAELTILETQDEWYKVETTDGDTGYVASWVVTFVKEDSSTTKKKSSSIAESTIMIDPGHGGDDPGAETNSGVYEKTITLKTANYIKQELEALGAKVILTRTSDKSVSLAARPELSNQYEVDAFISLHYDSTEDYNVASGTTTYYYSKDSLKLAKAINAELKAQLPLENRGVEYGDLQVLRDNNQASILLELGYLSNSTDSQYAVTKDYQKKVANAIADGLETYFQK